jgi:uncharacterized protein
MLFFRQPDTLYYWILDAKGVMGMKVAVTGATGFVGSRLVETLHSLGHTVVVLARSAAKAEKLFPAGVYPQVTVVEDVSAWAEALTGCDGVVNLAGEPIAEKRWTPEQKQRLVDSRIDTTKALVAAIGQANPRPQVLVNASAIGFYGTSETATFDETSPAGDDFLAELCQAWEAAAMEVKSGGTRLVILRSGIVLGLGGALGKMLPAFRLFAGGPIGSGNQWFSWIHRDDLVSLIIKALNDGAMQGVYNATAPNPVRMGEMCQVLGGVMGRPSWLPVPDFALEAMLGDGAKVVLEGQQVLPKNTLASGFEYQYSTVKPALAQILTTG